MFNVKFTKVYRWSKQESDYAIDINEKNTYRTTSQGELDITLETCPRQQQQRKRQHFKGPLALSVFLSLCCVFSSSSFLFVIFFLHCVSCKVINCLDGGEEEGREGRRRRKIQGTVAPINIEESVSPTVYKETASNMQLSWHLFHKMSGSLLSSQIIASHCDRGSRLREEKANLWH